MARARRGVACPPAATLPMRLPSLSSRFGCGDDHGAAEEQVERSHRAHDVDVAFVQRLIPVGLAITNDPIAKINRQREQGKRQKGAPLIFIDTEPKIFEPGATQRVRKIKPVHRIDVTARAVNLRLIERERAEETVKPRSQKPPARAQIENVWR